jgi:hypothetical protein
MKTVPEGPQNRSEAAPKPCSVRPEPWDALGRASDADRGQIKEIRIHESNPAGRRERSGHYPLGFSLTTGELLTRLQQST